VSQQVKLQTNNTEYASQEDEIDLRELWFLLWKSKWVILIITLCFTSASLFYSLSLPNEYKSTAILLPASASGTSSLSKLAGQFGGLATLAGVNLGAAESGDKTAVAMELIKTWGFLEDFIIDNNLELEVFAVKGWDKANNKVLIDASIYNEEESIWVKSKPTSWKLFSEIKGRISVGQNAKTGLVSLTVEHYSPYVAKRWVDLLVVAINNHIQMRDKAEALSSIKYLKQQIRKTNITEMRTIFYQLIEEQTKTLMLAEISSEYVFKTLSSAKVAEQKSKPKRSIIVVVGMLLGGGISVLFILFCAFIRKLKD